MWNNGGHFLGFVLSCYFGILGFVLDDEGVDTDTDIVFLSLATCLKEATIKLFGAGWGNFVTEQLSF